MRTVLARPRVQRAPQAHQHRIPVQWTVHRALPAALLKVGLQCVISVLLGATRIRQERLSVNNALLVSNVQWVSAHEC